MVFPIFIAITLLLMISFCVTSKRMHVFEIFFLWMISWLITHSIAWMVFVNLKWLKLSTDLGNFWTETLGLLILYPLLVIWFFDISMLIHHKVKKYALLLLAILIIASVEFCFILLDTIISKNWDFSYSLIKWSFIVSISYLLWQWYRKTLCKEGLI